MEINDFFIDGNLIFLSYLHRQHKKDPDYLPHPLIRALLCAVEASKGLQNGQRGMGNSSDGEANNITNSYAVVLEKTSDGFNILEIKDLLLGQTLPIDFAVVLFTLQIVIDRIPGNELTSKEVAMCLNDCFEEPTFVVLGDHWKAARDIYFEELKKGHVNFPAGYDSKPLYAEISKITSATPWEAYSPNLRSFIGASYARDLVPSGKNAVCITTPNDLSLSKERVFALAKQTLLGPAGEFMKRKYRQ